jgi:L-threonylcarbamoyladenylate synthase
MKTVKLNNINSLKKAIAEAGEVIKNGGSIVYPTDTVYGFGCNACDLKSVQQVFRIKKRPEDQPVPVLVRNMTWAREVAFIPPKLESVLMQLWPSKLTVVLPARKSIASAATGHSGSVGVRIADSEFVDTLLKVAGYPLVATSANISGERETNSPSTIADQFKNELWKPDLIMDVGPLSKSKPSTVLDMTMIRPRIIRNGAVPIKEIEAVLGKI